jgi:diguanylate cyclase (GGDEF)-like protein
MTHHPLHTLRVLLVEDDSSARQGLSLALETRVAQVLQAEDGAAGLELYRRLEPDVIITDLCMPRMDGLSMIRGVRDSGGDPFVIVASGHGAEESYLGAIELGVNMFLKKPYCATDILAGLDRACGEIAKRGRDAYRRALSDGLLAHVPNCHLLTDGHAVLYFNDPQSILPCKAAEGQELGPFLRANFTLALSHGMTRTSLPQGIAAWLARHSGREFILASQALREAGHPVRLLLRVDPVRISDRENHLLTFTDISRIESERERFFHQAGRDFLTGVGNRQAFDTELNREASRASRYGSDLCLVMLDIDDFKKVNDTFGHQVGDAVLVDLTRCMTAEVRVTDVVCRYGGEEFMIIMPQTGLEGALACSRKLGQAIADHDFALDRRITVSLGVAKYALGETPQTLVRRVDTALYEAKKTGKNKVVLAQPAPVSCQEN